MRYLNNFKVQFFLFCILFTTSSVIAEDVTKPHTFSAGTIASASEVNTNFDVLYEEINKLKSEIEQMKQTTGLPLADYDSGWFYVEKKKTYTKEHNLGSLPRLALMWAAKGEDGSNMHLMDGIYDTSGGGRGAWFNVITETSYQINTGSLSATYMHWNISSSGWIRIYMWK